MPGTVQRTSPEAVGLVLRVCPAGRVLESPSYRGGNRGSSSVNWGAGVLTIARPPTELL